MIKLSNFVSPILQIALGQDVIWSPACGCDTVVQPQVKNQRGTVTQRWRVGFTSLHSDVQLWDASVWTGPSGSIYSPWREACLCQGWLTSASACTLGLGWHPEGTGLLRSCPPRSGGTAPVWVASSSQGECASGLADVPRCTFPPTRCICVEDCRRNWQLHLVRSHLWGWRLGCAHRLCPPVCSRSWSLPWSLVPVSYGCSLDLRRLEREMCVHIAALII